jgi:hypothetical protein
MARKTGNRVLAEMLRLVTERYATSGGSAETRGLAIPPPPRKTPSSWPGKGCCVAAAAQHHRHDRYPREGTGPVAMVSVRVQRALCISARTISGVNPSQTIMSCAIGSSIKSSSEGSSLPK